jgi:hypothetical protein
MRNSKTRLGISARRHAPCLKTDNVRGYSFSPLKWRLVQQVEHSGLHLDNAGVYAFQELSHGWYLPPFSLEGKTVLDLGACCGETAWYFLKHGALKVISVESELSRVQLIRENKANLNLNIEIIANIFRPGQLLIPHDFLKCDIESYEMELLPYVKTLKPCIIETHGGWIRKQFEKAGFSKFQEIRSESADVELSLLNNFNVTMNSSILHANHNQLGRPTP